MQRQILISAVNENKLQAAEEWLSELAEATEVLVLAPTRHAADDFAWRLCLRQQGVFGMHRFTAAELAGTMATGSLALRELAPLSRLGLEALSARCVFRSLNESSLSYFEPVCEMPGFPRALASTLLELRLARVSPEGLSTSGKPGRDLALFLSFYEEELEIQSLADVATLFQLAREAVEEGEANLLGLPLLLLDVSPRSIVEKEFYRALSARAPAVFATVTAGDKEGQAGLGSVLELETQQLDRANDAGGGNAIDRIREDLFRPGTIQGGEPDPSFELFSAPGEGRECIEISRRILQAAREGIAFDRVAVLVRNPNVYQSQLEDAFKSAGIPGYFSQGATRPDPAGRALLSLLSCASEGVSASRFAEYLSLGQVPPVDESGEPSKAQVPWVQPSSELQMVFKSLVEADGSVSDADEADEAREPPTAESPVVAGTLRTPLHWEKLLVDAAVIGGKERWARRLSGLEAELRLNYEDIEEEDGRRETVERQLERLRNLKAFSLPLIEFLDGLPEQARWSEWLRALRHLSSMALRSPEPILSVLAELEPMGKVGPVGLSEVQQVLNERLTRLRPERPDRHYGRVFVGTLAEAQARSFQIVFVPGLAEGIFPGKILEDPLLLDEYRKQVSAELITRHGKSDEERLLLRTAVAAASQRLVASYPRMDVVQGRARVPSLYALELLRAAEGQLPDLKSLEKRAAQAFSTRLGWPAPRDTSAAVDDAEFDLATLDPLLHQPEPDITGRGRYLLNVNPCLARSLRARYKRWRPEWSDDDGIVAGKDEKLRQILAKHGMDSRSYSPTAMQSFSACPYRFFLYAIQRLQPREEISAIEQLDPLTRGSLFHAAQFQLFRKLQEADLLPMRPDRVEDIIDAADGVLDQIASKYLDELAPAILQVWESEIEEIRVDFRVWVREVCQADQQWKPIHFEYSFGLPLESDRDPDSSDQDAILLSGRHFRGVIDLVEKHQEQSLLRVTDHKTGRAPWPRPDFVGKGEILQPLLYGLAAEKLLGLPVGEGRLFYCTQRGDFQQVSIPLTKESRARIRQVVETIDGAIKSAFLPAAPREKACQYCDYKLVCGPYEEMRVGRKRKESLLELEEVRRMT